MKLNRLNTLFVFLMLFSVTASAQIFSLRNTSSLYLFESRDSSLQKIKNYRASDNLFFNFGSNLFSIRGNLNFYNDLNSSNSNKINSKVSSLNLSTEPFDEKIKLTLGRQFISNNTGLGNIDGLNFTFRPNNNVYNFNLYGGWNVIKGEDKFFKNKFSDNSNFGASISTDLNNGFFYRFNYSNKNWKKENYTALRTDSLFEPTAVAVISNPNVEEFFSLDGSFENKSFHIYSRADYNFLSRTLSRANIFTKYKFSFPLNLSLEYFFREPRVNFNSIFSVFHTTSINEIEISADYRLNNNFNFFTKFANVKYVDESSQRISLGLLYKKLNINYTKNFGYAGDLNGISLFCAHQIFENILFLNYGLGFATYKYDDYSPQSDVANLMLGSTYKISDKFIADVNFQFLKNPQFKTDVRGLFKISYLMSENFTTKNE